jgi:hypothetical protein
MHYRDEQLGILVDKLQAHLAEQFFKDSSDFILNTSSEQLTLSKKLCFCHLYFDKIKHQAGTAT